MTRTVITVCVSTLALAGVVGAQTAAPARPPEVQRLQGYVGNWTFEEHTRESPTAPEQERKGTWQARWLGDQIEWHSRWTAGERELTAVEVEGWDPVKKVQYSSWFLSDGTRGSMTGTWNGTTMVFEDGWVSADGKPGKARCAFTYNAEFTAVDYRCESGEQGKTWVSRAGKGVKVVPSTTTAMGTGKVLGIHEIALRPGVAPAEFERFVAEEWAPTVHDAYPGIEIRIYKGERGRAPGTYLLVYEIASLRVRDYYFPQPGTSSEAADALWKLCGERCDQVGNRLGELATNLGYTDYYALVKK